MTAYQKYQLRWMIEHDHSLDEMVSEMLAMQTDGDKIVFDGDVADLYSEWEYTSGFGGEIWACESEWKEWEGKTIMDAVYEQYVHDKNMPDEEKIEYEDAQSGEVDDHTGFYYVDFD